VRIAHGDLTDSLVTPEPYYILRQKFLRLFGLGLAAALQRECLEMNWFYKPAGGRA
jgi:hypothetical protein